MDARPLLLLGAAALCAAGPLAAQEFPRGAVFADGPGLARGLTEIRSEVLALRETARSPRSAPAPQRPQVCSALDFSGVSWPSTLGADDRSALELALNISGSYEGGDAWANISDNFDGQGLSLGLLNQNLGQGSLQPMLIRLRDAHPEKMAALMGPARLKSLLQMLDGWRATAAAESGLAPLSPYDDPNDAAVPKPLAGNAASVKWAVANLYKGKDFDPVWKAELMALASSPEFISIQIAAATDYHERALAYEGEIGVRELRSYLMLFDVNVQNGGLYQEDLDDFQAFAKKTPRADSAQKLEKLLDLRLRHVRKQYAQDVRARKQAIIRGAGAVHGEARNLPVQYCYDGAWPYR